MTETTQARVIDRTTLVWFALMIATVIAWLIGHDRAIGANLEAGTVILIAFIKVRFVGLDFMELRDAPLPLRLLFELWTVVTCATLILMASS